MTKTHSQSANLSDTCRHRSSHEAFIRVALMQTHDASHSSILQVLHRLQRFWDGKLHQDSETFYPKRKARLSTKIIQSLKSHSRLISYLLHLFKFMIFSGKTNFIFQTSDPKSFHPQIPIPSHLEIPSISKGLGGLWSHRICHLFRSCPYQRDEAVMVYKGGHLTKSGNINRFTYIYIFIYIDFFL